MDTRGTFSFAWAPILETDLSKSSRNAEYSIPPTGFYESPGRNGAGLFRP